MAPPRLKRERQFCTSESEHHLWERHSNDDGPWRCAWCKATSGAEHPCLRCGAEIGAKKSYVLCRECRWELWEMQDGR